MNNKDFAHLHVHNQYSILDGFGTEEKYITRAKEMGFRHIALTNHGNVDGCIKWQEQCKENDIHSILGCEAYIVPDMATKHKDEKRYHITLLAKNETGWRNLLKMLTYANIQGYYKRPRIDRDLLLDHLDGLVVMTACCGGFLKMEGGGELLYDINEATDTYIEIMPLRLDEQDWMNAEALRLSKLWDIPLVATNDCHYILKSQAELQEVLLAIQTKKRWNDPKRFRFTIDGLYLKSANEMIDSFKTNTQLKPRHYMPAMERTIEVAEKCSLFIEPKQIVLPHVNIRGFTDVPEDDQLIELAINGLLEKSRKHEWISDDLDTYFERLEEELNIIIKRGFERYFLIVYELINWCRDNDIMTGPGRGSVGSSLVAFSLGITADDPIKYNLLFSRFISTERIDLPDIDIDFEDSKRHLVREHLEDIYGKYCVAGVSTFSKMRGRSALRDVARVFDVPLVEVDKAAKSIIQKLDGDEGSERTIADAFDMYEDGIEFKKKYPKVSKIAMEMEGQVRGVGQHAAAMCVSGKDLRLGENANYSVRTKDLVCNWEKNVAEYMGLMKLDVLGLNALTVLNYCREIIKERRGIDIDYNMIDLNDSKVMAEFNRGNCIGVFQFAGRSIMSMCREMGVETFEDVVAINALHRPGCMRSGMTQAYRKRKHGEEAVTYIHPKMRGIMGGTYGLILYQEQIMQLVSELAGLPWKTADKIRKVVAKSKGEEEFMKFQKIFVDGCVKNGVEADDAERIFNELKYFGSYGFNRSHAVEYSMISVWMMWLKVHYPTEFFVALLTHGNDAKKEGFIEDARRLGRNFVLPDINNSHFKKWVSDSKGENLLIPIMEIKGIGEKAAKAICEEREKNGQFKGTEEFRERMPKRPVNAKVMKLLEAARVFDDQDAKLKMTEDELDEISSLFNFQLSNDPMHKYRKAVDKVGECIRINSIMDNGGRDWYNFGRIDALRYGKDNTGVYCDFSDDSGYKRLAFSNGLYKKMKYDIEHCEGQWMLIHPESGSEKKIVADRLWSGDNILKGEIDGLGIELAENVRPDSIDGVMSDVSKCHECQLRETCSGPALARPGLLNISIISEMPNIKEDGDGHVSHDLVFGNSRHGYSEVIRGLARDGLTPEHCHLTSVVKCNAGKGKKPKNMHFKKCVGYLDRELRIVKPFVVMAIGNLAVKFFKGESSGIMELNGRTEWNNDYECWVCYSINPAMVYHDEANGKLVNIALDNFFGKISRLGFGTMGQNDY